MPQTALQRPERVLVVGEAVLEEEEPEDEVEGEEPGAHVVAQTGVPIERASVPGERARDRHAGPQARGQQQERRGAPGAVGEGAGEQDNERIGERVDAIVDQVDERDHRAVGDRTVEKSDHPDRDEPPPSPHCVPDLTGTTRRHNGPERGAPTAHG